MIEKLLLVLILAAIASIAFADEQGLYLQAQVGASWGRMSADSRPPTISPPFNEPVRSDMAGVARLSAGYRIGAWALELGTGRLQRYSENRDWKTSCGGEYCKYDDYQDIVISTIEADIRVKRFFQVGEKTSFYPLAGLALVRWERELDNCVPSCANVQKSDGTNVKGQFGAGVHYRLTDHVSANLEYVITPGVLGITVQQLMGGVVYQF